MSIVAKKIMMGSGAVALPADPNFNLVGFLSHFDGSNSGVNNLFEDGSASNHTITANGNVTQGSFGPFALGSTAVYDPAVNGASAFLDGTGDYLSVASNSDFNIGANFTLECWCYPTAAATSSPGDLLMLIWDGSNDNSAWLSYTSASKFEFRISYTGGWAHTLTSSSTFSLNQWLYVTATRNSGTTYLFINGVQQATGSNNTDISGTGNVVHIGSQGGSRNFEGYIEDARIVNGTAVYTSNFTPPTAPLTAITNTKLLLNMANGQAIDNKAANNLNLFGTAKTSTAQKKFGTASLLLDGNSDYATFLENTANDIDGSGNWTVEFFWRFVNKASPTYQEIITKGNGFQIYTASGSLALALSSNNSSYDIANVSGGTTLDNDVFYHLALVKNGTSYKLYLNGTSETNLAVTSSSNLDTGGFPWFLGTLRTAETTYPSNGYMDEVRITKGLARYTANFTAPSEPFPDKGE